MKNQKAWVVFKCQICNNIDCCPFDSYIRNNRCGYCIGAKVNDTNSFATKFPLIISNNWSNKNTINPNELFYNSKTKIILECEKCGYNWTPRANFLTNCSICFGYAKLTNDSFSEKANKIHNDEYSYQEIGNGNKELITITHKKCGFIFRQTPHAHLSGSGCPVCLQGWTIDSIKQFIKNISIDGFFALTPIERYQIFLNAGILKSANKKLATKIIKGNFNQLELEKFIKNDENHLNPKISNINDEQSLEEKAKNAITVFGSELKQALKVDDKELINYLLNSGANKLWDVAYENKENINELITAPVNEFEKRIINHFLDEFNELNEIELPKNYSFKFIPNLMQLRYCNLVKRNKRFGNWSGMGSGKTLAAILASRMCNSNYTIIFCTNNTVEQWRKTIENVFPDSDIVYDLNWSIPKWNKDKNFHYLIINFSKLQHNLASDYLQKLCQSNKFDFIVIDEIQLSKQRRDVCSRRRRNLQLFIQLAEENKDLHIAAMSGTPIINNLKEGVSLLQLLKSLQFNEIEEKLTIPNCVILNRAFYNCGIRWKMNLNIDKNIKELKINGNEFVDIIKDTQTIIQLERILTKIKIPKIIDNISKGTIIYTHFIDGIINPLRNAIIEAGWSVGIFDGHDKSGLDEFINGKINVLIASSSISYGIDGLQNVCSQLIFNILPWTSAEFEQVISRIWRQGQQNNVDILIPLVTNNINNDEWSWCQSKLNNIKYKRSISDCVIDGKIPDGSFRTNEQFFKDQITLIKRLDKNQISEIKRIKSEDVIVESEEIKRNKIKSEFLKINTSWNVNSSSTTHQKLQTNPQDWHTYHELRKDIIKTWVTDPCLEMIELIKAETKFKNKSYVMADFGCGTAKVADALDRKITVHSFDHVAFNKKVTACDMAQTNLETKSIDLVLFCLSISHGHNKNDYLAETKRILKPNGLLYVVEPASNPIDLWISSNGFKLISKDKIDKFNIYKFLNI